MHNLKIQKDLPKKSGRPRVEVPNKDDVHLGARVKQRRIVMGLSQEKLGKQLGITFQQVQKYERGVNRISASRLMDMSRILDVPITFFYDNLPANGFAENKQEEYLGKDPDKNPLMKRETLELVRAYCRISDPLVRKRVLELTKAMAKAESDSTSG
jgi:transcriptional regulator with XRE-family HTH domain